MPTMVRGRTERDERSWPDRIPAELVSAIEILLLGLLALLLVLQTIPESFGIASSCVRQSGVVTNPGYAYIGALAVFGTLGWVGVFLGTAYASIAGRHDILVLLPAIWFLVLVLSALAAAVLVGPAPCPS